MSMDNDTWECGGLLGVVWDVMVTYAVDEMIATYTAQRMSG